MKFLMTALRESPRRVLVAYLAGLALIVGCAEDDGRIEVYPVSGKVLVRGAPAEAAQVVFYPVAEELRKPGMPIPEAVTDAEGIFQLRSYDPKDGAPAGEYTVSVYWPGPAPPDADPAAGTYNPKDRLAGRYLDPNKSGLNVTIEEGGAELPPFELQ
jgi:hypothetical protein